ncbi:hypothetical protein NEOLI_004121 [Neolecta irregularis DAH-3]|uniref:Uncharacterized protein n=1 Tax=Neolecta irregularis (strain DAH-3) TaxID=1198029 RepID=A0A1U7LQP2_NEOID|nr:hypothetical protein NEOLI_004121 [Neolecta irregularis DAH-3]|eukprot:OLL24872.1 hypothetical protein NEOLI_004121 [Neolecta irregularis DAH-3]
MSSHPQYPIRRNDQSYVGVPFMLLHKYQPIGQRNKNNNKDVVVRYAWVPEHLWRTGGKYTLSTHLGLSCLSFVQLCRESFEREFDLGTVSWNLEGIFDVERIKIVWNGVGAYGRVRLAKLPLQIRLSATAIEAVEVHLPVNPSSYEGWFWGLQPMRWRRKALNEIIEPDPVLEISPRAVDVGGTGLVGGFDGWDSARWMDWNVWNERHEYIEPESYFWRDPKTMALFAFVAVAMMYVVAS